MFDWDGFICHASEDRDAVAAPLEETLRAVNVYLWFDRHQIGLSDSIHDTISAGLRRRRFAIVVLSPSFRRSWAAAELAAFVALEAGTRRRVLPVWHDLDEGFVAQHFPLLLDRRAAKTEEGIDQVANQILRAMLTASIEDVDELLVRLRKTYAAQLEDIGSAAAREQQVEGDDWKSLKTEFARVRIWVPQKAQKGRWNHLRQHLDFGQVLDLHDIVETDWPSVRRTATDFFEQRQLDPSESVGLF